MSPRIEYHWDREWKHLDRGRCTIGTENGIAFGPRTEYHWDRGRNTTETEDGILLESRMVFHWIADITLTNHRRSATQPTAPTYSTLRDHTLHFYDRLGISNWVSGGN